MATKKKAPAKKAPARKAPPRKAGRPAFKAGPARAKKAGKNPERKLPRKYGPRRKTPKSIGREAAPAVQAPTAPDEVRPVAMLVAKAGLDKKAEDVALYDVRGLSSYADYLVIMSVDSDRQAGAVADNVDAVMKAAGHTKIAGSDSVNNIFAGLGNLADQAGEIAVLVVLAQMPAQIDLQRGGSGLTHGRLLRGHFMKGCKLLAV